MMITTKGKLYLEAVSNSIALKPKALSPTIAMTGLLGFTALAATANGIPIPIVPNVPLKIKIN